MLQREWSLTVCPGQDFQYQNIGVWPDVKELGVSRFCGLDPHSLDEASGRSVELTLKNLFQINVFECVGRECKQPLKAGRRQVHRATTAEGITDIDASNNPHEALGIGVQPIAGRVFAGN